MTRRITARAEVWPLKGVFTISRGAKTDAHVVVAEIIDGPHTGRGEAVPYARYGETVDGVVAAVEGLGAAIAGGLDRDGLAARMPAGAARNAVDCALWDVEAKRTGKRVWDLAGVAAPHPVITAETISIDSVDAMGRAAAALADRPLIKVKLDAEEIVSRVAAVRHGAPDARLIVDANEAWSVEVLARVGADLDALGVAMIEQPLPAGADAALHDFDSPVPLCADESCHGTDSLAALAGAYAMVNVKLDKTGGLTAALDLVRSARSLGFGVMVGCMVGTSLAMAPAVVLSGDAQFVDLDGPLWLAGDRTPGLDFTANRVHPPEPEVWG